jgi:hypothetical protein
MKYLKNYLWVKLPDYKFFFVNSIRVQGNFFKEGLFPITRCQAASTSSSLDTLISSSNSSGSVSCSTTFLISSERALKCSSSTRSSVVIFPLRNLIIRSCIRVCIVNSLSGQIVPTDTTHLPLRLTREIAVFLLFYGRCVF